MSSTEGKRTIVRKTIKFIICSEDVPAFIRDITPFLPISPFKTGNGQFKTGVDRILNNSVYFDSNDFTMYEQRALKADKAELYRTRWYGENLEQDSYFLERKRHRNTDQTGKQSTKKRALLKADHEDHQDYENLQKFISVIEAKGLSPKVQTSYYRTSFMSQEIEGLRVTIDDDIQISNPNNNNNNNNNDINISNNITTLPFSIIEVKVSSSSSSSSSDEEVLVDKSELVVPQWLNDIISNHDCQKIKFSKFNMGCHLLYPHNISMLPPCLDQLADWVSENSHKNEYIKSYHTKFETCLDMTIYKEFEGEEDNNTTQDQGKAALLIDKFVTKFEDAHQSGQNFKFDMKALMGAERTYMKYVQFAITLATFALGFSYNTTTTNTTIHKALVITVVLAADIMLSYATIVYHLRRNFIIGTLEKKGIDVPRYFNDWVGNLSVVSIFALVVNIYMIYALASGTI
eukprot:Pgem_evm1s643